MNLTNWRHVGYPLNKTDHIVNLTSVEDVKLPAFFAAKFQLPANVSEPQDTFVNMDGWTKVSSTMIDRQDGFVDERVLSTLFLQYYSLLTKVLIIMGNLSYFECS